jgi:hypothetical protein
MTSTNVTLVSAHKSLVFGIREAQKAPNSVASTLYRGALEIGRLNHGRYTEAET